MPASLAEIEAFALSIAVSTSWAFIRTQHGGRPKHVDTLRAVLERHSIPKKNYVLHPASLARALGDVIPDNHAIVSTLEARLRLPSIDPLNLFKDPCMVPLTSLERVRRDFVRIVSNETFRKRDQLLDWLVSQSYCSVLVDVDAVIGGLVELGALVIDQDSTVWYIDGFDDAMGDYKGDVALFLPYMQPWLLECPPSPSDIPIAHIRPSRVRAQNLSQEMRTTKDCRGKGRSRIRNRRQHPSWSVRRWWVSK